VGAAQKKYQGDKRRVEFAQQKARERLPMKQSKGKQIVYRFNGDSSTQQTVSDRTGTLLTPLVGAIVKRNGMDWRVVGVREELDVKGPMSVAIHHVFLSHAA
jgi:hypothetical protein